jgi:hypothetical protein
LPTKTLRTASLCRRGKMKCCISAAETTQQGPFE